MFTINVVDPQKLKGMIEYNKEVKDRIDAEEAEKAANCGRKLHPAASPGALAMCELNFADALITCKLAARALARWPTSVPRVMISEQHRAEQRLATAARRRRRAAAHREVARQREERFRSHE